MGVVGCRGVDGYGWYGWYGIKRKENKSTAGRWMDDGQTMDR